MQITKLNVHFKLLSRFVIFLFFFCLSNITISEVYAASSPTKIFDYANLFSGREIETLEKEYRQSSDAADIDIILITNDDMEGKTSKRYLEDFYDQVYLDNTINPNAALFLINMQERNLTIQGYGSCETSISDNRIEYMLDDLSPIMKDGNYYEAASLFAKEAEFYDGEKNTKSYYGGKTKNQPFYLKPWFLAIIGLVIGTISVSVMAANAGGKVTTSSNTYLNSNSPGVIGHQDQFMYTSVTKVKRPKDNDGDRSSGGGGVSSGGHSHSGGSRDF